MNIKFELLDCEYYRRKTFVRWPHKYPLSPHILARHGFYFCGGYDTIKCHKCSLMYFNLEPGAFIDRTHEKMTDCVYSHVFTPEYVTYNNVCDREINTSSAAHANYVHLSTRLATFNSWPTWLVQQPLELAEAGFVYTGIDDNVYCFMCDCNVREWKYEDDPWVRHTLASSGCCVFLKATKGCDYVKSIIAGNSIMDTTLDCGRQNGSFQNHRLDVVENNNSDVADDDSDVTIAAQDSCCSICLDNDRNACLIPCGHLICLECAENVEVCPFCREGVITVQRIYAL
ncbi:iap-3 [Hemileuca sp. nucleopolyhedrovirus]|uniref:Iap-3 n=1 Tax=Hemileuca sp. nucleopolyhedrovirus TaxID=1367203 RepID=S5MK11_9ABAC|nr:iap-3 [Hemileuca sp. nucleopolyhedrovirus]AGR56791.1 iap-3 [Hemileuca sp. nucleopolyhedrovirus]